MKKPNPKKQVLVISYHKVLSKEEHRQLGDHVKINLKGTGIIDTDLPVYTASDSVAYAGPHGIHEYLENKCAFEIFIDNCSTNDDDGKGTDADFYFDGKQLWVWAFDKMHSMDEWIKVVQDSYPDEDLDQGHFDNLVDQFQEDKAKFIKSLEKHLETFSPLSDEDEERGLKKVLKILKA